MPRDADWWMHVNPSLPLTEHTVEVEGLPIYYRTGGSGPPLLLLHGGTQRGQQWNPFLDALGEHYTVIVPDLPGHGRSPTFPPEGLSLPATARVMLGLVEALGIEHVRGIGQSGGACVLLHMANRDTERMEAIVVVGGAHHFVPKARQIIAGWYWENLPGQQQRLLAMHPGGMPQIRTLLEKLLEVAGPSADPSAFDIPTERLKEIPTRVLFVLGDRDWAYPLEVVLEAYRALPHAALWVIPGGNHAAVWDLATAGAMFPEIVLGFLGERLVE